MAMLALAKIEITATEVLMVWGVLMRGGVAVHHRTSKPSIVPAIATHLQERMCCELF
jgi:hypothetical protein